LLTNYTGFAVVVFLTLFIDLIATLALQTTSAVAASV